MRRLAAAATVVLTVLVAWGVLYRPSPSGQAPLERGEIVQVIVLPPLTENCLDTDSPEALGRDYVSVAEDPPPCREHEVISIGVGNGDEVSLLASAKPGVRVMRRVAGGLFYWPFPPDSLRLGQTVHVWGNGLMESSPAQTDTTAIEVQ